MYHRRSSIRQPPKRQPGSGTHLGRNAQLRRIGADPDRIEGQRRAEKTDAAVALPIAEGSAKFGSGLEAAAAAFRSDLVRLAAPAVLATERSPLRNPVALRKNPAALGELRGCDARSSGALDRLGWIASLQDAADGPCGFLVGGCARVEPVPAA